MKRLLVAWLLGMALASTASTEPEWTVVEAGRAGFHWSFSLKLNPDRVPPGGVIANESRWSEPPASGSGAWTVHAWIKQAILLYFAVSKLEPTTAGPPCGVRRP